MKTVAVVLSGCGYLDGAEIRESVAVLLALARQKVTAPAEPRRTATVSIAGCPKPCSIVRQKSRTSHDGDLKFLRNRGGTRQNLVQNQAVSREDAPGDELRTAHRHNAIAHQQRSRVPRIAIASTRLSVMCICNGVALRADERREHNSVAAVAGREARRG